jgi:hypothetical protein
MATVKDHVYEAMYGYTGEGLNSFSYLTQSADGNFLTVVDVANLKHNRYIRTSLIVRIIDQHIIIEHDQNDKPLVDTLLELNISRHQITLAYAGESVPETV